MPRQVPLVIQRWKREEEEEEKGKTKQNNKLNENGERDVKKIPFYKAPHSFKWHDDEDDDKEKYLKLPSHLFSFFLFLFFARLLIQSSVRARALSLSLSFFNCPAFSHTYHSLFLVASKTHWIVWIAWIALCVRFF